MTTHPTDITSPLQASTESLSSILNRVFDPEREETKLGTLLEELHHHGLAVILILFSIPAALPLPAAGYSTVLSVPLFLIGFCFLTGRDSISLPKRIENSTFKPASFKKVRGLLLRISKTVEKFSKPRFTQIVRSVGTRLGLGVLIILLASSMVLPIPGTNTLPAGGIFLIGFSLLEDDGLILLLGVLYSIAALILTMLIIYFGYEAVKFGISSLGSLFF